MINLNNQDAIYAYDLGFKSGMDDIPFNSSCDRFYRLGYITARKMTGKHIHSYILG